MPAPVKRPRPLWVKSGHRGGTASCALYPQKRTLELSRAMSALCQKRTWTSYSITRSTAASSDGGMVKPTAPRLFSRAADTPPFQVLSRGSLMILASVLALVYQWYVIRGVVLLRCGWHRQKIEWALVDGKLDKEILSCERFAHGRRWRATALRLHRRVH